ncbi:MAG: PIN domain-containing protein [Thermoleophilia bacterium]|nr:PIN domain-containing protein [Thermoleophilia bacterium]
MSSPAAALVDTNILVYAYDPLDRAKQQHALYVLEQLEREARGAVSTQVLGEFFTTVTRKLRPPLSHEEAGWNVAAFVRGWTVCTATSAAVLEAIRAVGEHQVSYWDGLIWATAKLSGIATVLTEDLSHGRLIEGVRFLNPFAPAFDVAALR